MRGLILQHHALTHFTFKHIVIFLPWSTPFSFQCFFFNQTIHIQFLFTNSTSLGVWERLLRCSNLHCVSLINLPPFADSFVLSTRNRFQLFMPIFHKYLGDGISKQTMPGDTNPHLQQRSFNALENWPAVDRHLLLSSAALQWCWHSKKCLEEQGSPDPAEMQG